MNIDNTFDLTKYGEGEITTKEMQEVSVPELVILKKKIKDDKSLIKLFDKESVTKYDLGEPLFKNDFRIIEYYNKNELNCLKAINNTKNEQERNECLELIPEKIRFLFTKEFDDEMYKIDKEFVNKIKDKVKSYLCYSYCTKTKLKIKFYENPIKRFNHSIDVANTAIEIADFHCMCFNDSFKKIIYLAGILHDVCKYEDDDNHGLLGSVWIHNNLKNMFSEKLLYLIMNIVEVHSEKGTVKDLSIFQKIIQDADTIENTSIVKNIRIVNSKKELIKLCEKMLNKIDKSINKLNFELLDDVLTERKSIIKDLIESTKLEMSNDYINKI